MYANESQQISKLYGSKKSVSQIQKLDQSQSQQVFPIHSNSNLEKSCLLKPLDLSQVKAEKVGFGTKARRQLTQFAAKSYSSILCYSNISFFQDNQNKLSGINFNKPKPFISSTNRFNDKIQKLPGPGKYETKYQFQKYQINKQKKPLPILCPIKKYVRENYEVKKVLNGNQNYQNDCFKEKNNENEFNKFVLREKVKQKFKQQRQKLLQLKQMYKIQKRIDFKPILRKNVPDKDQTISTSQKKLNKQCKIMQQNNKLNLKQITSKFFPKKEYHFEQPNWRQKQNLYANKFCYDRAFIQTNDKPFHSYIVLNQNPGPGTYQIRKKLA